MNGLKNLWRPEDHVREKEEASFRWVINYLAEGWEKKGTAHTTGLRFIQFLERDDIPEDDREQYRKAAADLRERWRICD